MTTGNQKLIGLALLALIVATGLGGCGKKTSPEAEAIKNSRFRLNKIPQSCTTRTEYPATVRECRKKICNDLKGDHCKGGLDDMAAASLVSCIKEKLALVGADRDDCRLFVYDLKNAIGKKE